MTSEMSAAQAAFRFALELAAMVAWGIAGWRIAGATSPPAAIRWAAVVGVVVVVAALWGTFRVPGDASASGAAPVAVAGTWRLGIELAVLIGAAAAVAAAGSVRFAAGLAGLVAVHYLTTWDRVSWLWSH